MFSALLRGLVRPRPSISKSCQTISPLTQPVGWTGRSKPSLACANGGIIDFPKAGLISHWPDWAVVSAVGMVQRLATGMASSCGVNTRLISFPWALAGGPGRGSSVCCHADSNAYMLPIHDCVAVLQFSRENRNLRETQPSVYTFLGQQVDIPGMPAKPPPA